MLNSHTMTETDSFWQRHSLTFNTSENLQEIPYSKGRILGQLSVFFKSIWKSWQQLMIINSLQFRENEENLWREKILLL